MNVHKGQLYSTCETEETPQTAGATNEPGKIAVFSDINVTESREILVGIFRQEFHDFHRFFTKSTAISEEIGRVQSEFSTKRPTMTLT